MTVTMITIQTLINIYTNTKLLSTRKLRIIITNYSTVTVSRLLLLVLLRILLRGDLDSSINRVLYIKASVILMYLRIIMGAVIHKHHLLVKHKYLNTYSKTITLIEIICSTSRSSNNSHKCRRQKYYHS